MCARAYVIGLIFLAACASPPPVAVGPLVAHLGTFGGDRERMAGISEAFARRNPGYGLEWLPECNGLSPTSRTRVLLVQQGKTEMSVRSGAGEQHSEVTVGDVVLVRPGEAMVVHAVVGALVFTVPSLPPAAVPAFVRPDWDPRLTDTPGGCATEAGAYRRILLTWKKENGPYTWDAFNCHRVRIADSFTHYHPLVGGFDEFYLVQMVQPGAQLLTSDQLARIEQPGAVTADEAAGLLRYTDLHVGDLVYLPRGLVHRGRGGVLAQVVTVPGFVPGAEIGVDHHLRAIDERLGLTGSGALPFHQEGSQGPVVR